MSFTKDLLAHRHIVISGGAGALGAAIVKGLTSHGARVTVNDVVENHVAISRLEQSGIDSESFRYIRADITDGPEADRLIAEARSAFGPVHTALCHAGIVIAKPLLAISQGDWERTMDVNLKAAFLLGKSAARTMLDDAIAGHLIFTTSWVSETPWPEIGPYNASKAGMNQLMRSFARELAPRVRANAIAPGIVGAGMAKIQWDTDPTYRARAQRAIPLGVMQTLESVVSAFLFLCSPAASYMTGSVLVVDGGCSLYPMD